MRALSLVSGLALTAVVVLLAVYLYQRTFGKGCGCPPKLSVMDGGLATQGFIDGKKVM